MGLIDKIVSEPVGGAHRDPVAAARMLGAALTEEIDLMAPQTGAQLIAQREARFLGIGG